MCSPVHSGPCRNGGHCSSIPSVAQYTVGQRGGVNDAGNPHRRIPKGSRRHTEAFELAKELESRSFPEKYTFCLRWQNILDLNIRESR